jgi:hypothetical protein
MHHSMNYRSVVMVGALSELTSLEEKEQAIEEASVKCRSGGPVDDEADLTYPCWAGVLPLSYLCPSSPASPRPTMLIRHSDRRLPSSRPTSAAEEVEHERAHVGCVTTSTKKRQRSP